MREVDEMTGFGDHLIQSLNEALAHASDEGPAKGTRCRTRNNPCGAPA